jgi:hypothetical protein
MTKFKFNRSDSFKEIITINGRKFKHFNLLTIPSNFGCRKASDTKEGISEYINYKGLTYYAEA